MAIRELSYVFRRDPETGAERFSPVAEAPDGVPEDLMRRVIAATHRPAPASQAALSYTRLPHRDGGGLLCSARPDEESPGLRVDACYEAGEPEGTRWRWPVDAFRRSTVAGQAGEAFAPEGWFWDDALLTKFASEQGPRIAPYLADVRRLFADPAGRQIVLAERDQETVARWIALACASLPVEYARALTFTTGAADPGAAPHQIIGIGPDTDHEVFDRYDTSTITHLFRVHDGLGGPGSPPRPDSWAALTAWLWQEQVIPRPGEPDDPFALLPLLRRALTTRARDAFDSLPDDLLHDTLTVALRTAEKGPLDDATAEDLAEIARRIGTHHRDAVQPLLAALLRCRAKAAHPQDAVRMLEAARGDLPLDDRTWRTVRSEFGPPPEDELRTLLRRSPSPAWEKPLRALLAPGADRGDTVDQAALRLALALSRPDQRQTCADAVALLAALADRAFTRRVLNRLAENAEDRRVRAIRDLAASPHGVWLRDHLDGAPFVVRVAASAAELGGGTYGLAGVELWTDLANRHLGGEVPDVAALKMLWTLAWPSHGGLPRRHEQDRITQVCPARLIVEAGLEVRLTQWLKHPERVDSKYVEFARATTGSRKFTPSERATAQLVVLARDFRGGRVTVGKVLKRLPELQRAAGHLDDAVRDAVEYWIACGMARTDPDELFDSEALRYLATGNLRLLDHYATAVKDARREGGALEPAALREPRRVAALFVAWAEPQHGATGRWIQLSGDLIHDVLGAALPSLDERDLGKVAGLLAGRDQRWVQAWNSWRDRLQG